MNRSLFVGLLAAAGAPSLWACGGDCLSADPKGVSIRFEEPSSELEDFLAHPWPSDALKRPNGNLELSHFPNPSQSSTLNDYLGVIGSGTQAYSVSGAIYMGATGALDPASLPATPAGAMAEDSSVQLIDIDPSSRERGRRYPLRVRFGGSPTQYLHANQLVALPPFGATLLGGTRYALIVSDRVRAENGDDLVPTARVRNLLLAGCPAQGPELLTSAFATLREYLSSAGVDASEIVGATVFTTQRAVDEIRALVAVAREQPSPVASNLLKVRASRFTNRYSGEIELPGFQHGVIPYRTLGDGGELAHDIEGRFTVDHQEHTRIGIAIPSQLPMPSSGWPVVLYSHGTGGDYTSAFEDEVSDRLGRQGVAVVSYDQTLHGPRDPTGSDPSLTFFNLFNPVAARDNVRQGAADLAVMTTLLGTLALPDALTMSGEAHFDPSRIGFLGHSQGSLVGAPFVAADPRPRAIVFSGLGAILQITLQERKDIVNFSALLRSLLEIPEAEALDDFHPVLNLIQTFVEPADPIAYARSYLPDPPEGARRDVLMVEGFLDFASPARGQEAFSVAAGLPIVAPLGRLPDAAAILGPEPQPAPAEANVPSRSGSVTYGLIQYPEETHYPIFENEDANRRYVELFRSSLIDGRGRILESQ